MKYQNLISMLFSCFLVLSTPLTSNANYIDKDNLSMYKKQIKASIKLFEETDRKNWSYKVVRFENEEGDVSSSTEVFTPNEDKSKRWEQDLRFTGLNSSFFNRFPKATKVGLPRDFIP